MNKSLKAAGVVSSACAAAIAALFALSTSSANAAGSTGARLSMSGVQTSDAPGGTGTVTITAGDTVVFSLAKPPTRAGAPVLGYSVTLNPSSFPGSPGDVTLTGTKTYAMTFGSPGHYPFTWTASSALGRITPRSGEYTNATIIVNAAPDPGGGGGGGGGSTPPPGSDPPPTSSGAGTPTGPGGTVSAPGLPGVPGTTAPLSFIITTNAAGLPVSVPVFGPPHDTGTTGVGSAAVIGLHGTAGSLAGSGVSSSGVAGNAVADPQFVADPHASTPPRALAVLSILSLTVVAALYAYTYLGRRAAAQDAATSSPS